MSITSNNHPHLEQIASSQSDAKPTPENSDDTAPFTQILAGESSLTPPAKTNRPTQPEESATLGPPPFSLINAHEKQPSPPKKEQKSHRIVKKSPKSAGLDLIE
ncbi:MAG: hypothetical protein L3J28_05620 [Candidatus Polarisedimenticolaceae bacterium]|nr:hypothetical protein [Candidatus Polarisedimenticolaceae bacterium]